MMISRLVLALGLLLALGAPLDSALGERERGAEPRRVHLVSHGAGRSAVRAGRLLPGDFDVFSVWARKGSLLAVSVHTRDGGDLGDPILGVRAPRTAAFEILSDDGGPGFLPRGAVAVDRTGFWKIAVSGFGDDKFEGNHEERLRYRVTFAVIPRPERIAENEGRNDDPRRAPRLFRPGDRGPVAIVTGILEPGDVDYFRLPRGHRALEISLFDNEGGEFNDSVLRIATRGGSILASNDDGGPLFLSNLRTPGRCDTQTVAVDGFDPDPGDDEAHREAFVYHLLVTIDPWRRRGSGCRADQS